MKKKRRAMVWLLTVWLLTGLVACSGNDADQDNSQEEEKILYAASNFAYASVDAHKEYYGWYTSVYGVTESLFRLTDDSAIEPWLAESGSCENNVWTIRLREDICFSNGNPVTAEMVVRNLERAAIENSRFAYLEEFRYVILDEHTFTIESEQVYPTMLATLASPELGIMDLDNIQDFDQAIIGTGPFLLETFEPEGTVTVVRNEQYWDGRAELDGAVFYYMQDDDAKLLAMQNGEIDCYNSVTAAAMEIYESDPEACKLVSVPSTRLQFYILNHNTLSEPVRRAISLAIDNEAMASYLGGTVTPTDGPFISTAAYGKVSGAEPDPEAAADVLEAEGYVKNSDGYYEQDGEVLTLNIAYYASRSLDTLAALMQEQLRTVGIRAELTCEEDPDATYIASGDFDIALYCLVADTSGDPEYFITSTLAEGSYFDVGGFEHERCEELIGRLIYETDTEKRAELANEIIQISIDEHALGYIGLFNKVTVLRDGVSGFAENSPYDFYGIDVNTQK